MFIKVLYTKQQKPEQLQKKAGERLYIPRQQLATRVREKYMLLYAGL